MKTGNINQTDHYYKLLFENAYDAMFVENTDGQIVDVNPAACRLLGYTREELISLNVADLLPPSDNEVHAIIEEELATNGRSFGSWNLHKNGSKIPVEVRVNRLDEIGQSLLLVIVREISDRREAEAKVEREKLIFASLHAMAIGLMQRSTLTDVLTTIIKHVCRILDTENAFIYMDADDTGFLELKVGSGIYENHIGYRQPFGAGLVGKVWQSNQPVVIENYQQWDGRLNDRQWSTITTAAGIPLRAQGKVVGVMGLDVFSNDHALKTEDIHVFERLAELASIAIDNALLEERLQFLSYRDALTGLYNRAYFEGELAKLSTAADSSCLIICDLDELKLVNDLFGHEEGDELLIKAARLLQDCFGERSAISRIGGDEFAIIVQNVQEKEIEAKCRRLKDALHQLKEDANSQIPLEISVGYAMSTETAGDAKAQFRLADNRMYREKLHNRNFRGSFVQTMKQMLAERDYLTEGHADRMQAMVVELARAVGQTEKDLNDIRLFAQFHDIGKIGIPDRILFKPGPLDPQERQEMQRHSEIGQRIAQTSLELQPIAEWILKHHERWDGQGYPLGLSQSDIPMECRILAVVDAYDAMTSDRPYRKGLPMATALAELSKNAGSQFDPLVVEAFFQLVKEKTVKAPVTRYVNW